MHMATAEGDHISVRNVVLSLCYIGSIALHQCKKHSPNPKDSSDTRSLYITGNNMNLLSLRVFSSICLLKVPDLRTAQIVYLILLPASLISILMRFC